MTVILIIIYILITERLLLGKLYNEYNFFRYVYKMYMPEAIISKEKRIKFWLIKHDVLNK